MLSAPAAMRAIRDESFRPALAPLSVGTLIRSSASFRSPALPARAISGTRPAAATRLGSSNVADTTGRVWESCIYKMPFLNWRYGPSASPSSQLRGASWRSATLSSSVDRGLVPEGPGDQRWQQRTSVRNAISVVREFSVVVTAGGVRDRRQQQRQGAAIEACGQVAEIDRMALGDARGRPQHLHLAAASEDETGRKGPFDIRPGDLGPEAVAVDVLGERDQVGGLQLRQPV